MKSILAVLALLPSLALAQGVVPGKMRAPSIAPAVSAGPRIPDDAGTICHAWFDGTQIQDTKGCAWEMTGTVPQVAASGYAPAGAGPFAVGNYYTLGTGNDVLDLSGASFTVCAVYKVGADNQTETIFSNGSAALNGGYSIAVGTQYTTAVLWGSAVAYTAQGVLGGTSTAAGVTGPLVICAGRSGTNTFSQFAFTSQVITAAPSPVAGTGAVAKIGVTNGNSGPALGTLYEIIWTTTAPSKALVDKIAARVLATY